MELKNTAKVNVVVHLSALLSLFFANLINLLVFKLNYYYINFFNALLTTITE